ncbi:cytochrome c-type biogenesis protein [Oceanospirillum linum]|uniref:cytochrome c-type biogenesis protein n=1 Tax=Oceanospirillum linum TaxID=966 RepID=UPI00089E8C7D|nr:cytochrome c-type biogenesis protein [Oceanospirillum linum]SEF60306.1 cytochrome c-type biogenesis protein CcmH [Oleiphilus messinensis]SMP06926.1 cytochrome c-type biogenesis protein CcmH [Oceanospirillum linum]
MEIGKQIAWYRINTLWFVLLIVVSIGAAFTYAPTAQATIDAFEFKNDELRTRYQDLAAVLRCPKCQNQNIIDSDAGIAADLRQQVYRLLNEGYTDDEILDFMVARYGNFVLYEPPVNSLTYLLWYGPFVLLFLAGIVVFFLLRGNRSAAQAAQQINEDDRERLNKLLNKKSD